MPRRLVYPLLAVAVALVLLWLERRGPLDSGGALAPASDDVVANGGAAEMEAQPAHENGAAATRAEGLAAAADAAWSESAPIPPTKWTARGLVVDIEGRPCAGLAVVALPSGSHALSHADWAAAAETASRGAGADGVPRTDVDGRFETVADAPIAFVYVHDAQWTTLYAGHAGAHAASEDALVVVARAVRSAGHVVDETDLPVPGATLSPYDELAPSLPGFPLPLSRSVRVAWTWSTDRTGAFDLCGLGLVPRRRVDVAREGYNRTYFWPTAEDRFDWLVVMERTPEPPPGGFGFRSEPLLFGFVRDAEGTPIAGARVMLCEAKSTTNDAGRFELERPGWIPDGRVALVARAPDGRVAIERDSSTWSGGGADIGPIELIVSADFRTLPGRVLDERGASLAGWRVGIIDATLVDVSSRPPLSVERGLEPGAEWPTTDGEGRFALRGLSDREYRVCAFEPTSLVSVEVAVPRGQRELEIVVSDRMCIEELRGVVIDAAGRPVRGVEVVLSSIIERLGLGAGSGPPCAALSDAEGRFRLAHVPRSGSSLMFLGASIRTRGHALTDSELDAAFVEVRVDRALLIQIDARGADPLPTSVRFLDDADRTVLASHPGGGHENFADIDLYEGRSGVLAVGATARSAVFSRNGVEVARVRLEPSSGQVTIVRGF